MNNKVNEIWRAIKEYPNYEVSNQGRVRNIKTHRILQPSYTKDGYQFVGLYKDGKQKYYRINRLVAEAFIPIPQTYLDKGYSKETLQVDHIDENKQNNSVANLQWLTHKENLVKSKALCVVGYNHDKMIITDQYNKLSTYYTDKYQKGFNKGTICQCCNHKIKRAYNYKWQYLTKNLYNLLKKFAEINPNIEVVE